MPPSVENCVKRLLGDPDFKPYTGQSKKDSAWAICTAQYEKETGKPAKKYKMEKATVTSREEKRKELDMSVSEFYAVPREPPSASKLPIFDAAHVRNALARLDQVKGISAEEKKRALKAIFRAAKKFKIDVDKDEAKSNLKAKAMKPVKPMPDGSCPEGYRVDRKLGMCMPLDDRKPQDEAYEKYYTEDVVNQIGILKGYLK